MEENKINRMALIRAYCRGFHATYDTPKIFNDFLAYQLLGEGKHASFDQLFMPSAQQVESLDPTFAATKPDRKSMLAWGVQNFAPLALAVSRAHYTENLLEQAIEQGVQQYVILGAGLDTFAFRRPELAGKLQVFEIDHPVTQAFKRDRLMELGWILPGNLHFIPADFTKESLADALKNSHFDPQVLSFFSCQGVDFYLSRDEVCSMLRSIANVALAGSPVVFDYFDSEVFVPEKTSILMQKSLEDARQHGEPVKSGFDPSTLAGELATLGLRLDEDLSPHDIEERFFQGRTDYNHAYELIHYASAVVE